MIHPNFVYLFLSAVDLQIYHNNLSERFCMSSQRDCCSCRDEGVHWAIQNGLQLSRSTVVYFKHNDMESLRNMLEKVTQENKRAKKLRRYIVVEAVYQVLFGLL